MVASDSWREDLETWLAPFLADLTHPAQRRMCPTYIAGLIGPGDRKSIQPLAARTQDAGYDQLHHFIASGTWDAAPLKRRLLAEADKLVGDAKGFLVIDDTALPSRRDGSANRLIDSSRRNSASTISIDDPDCAKSRVCDSAGLQIGVC